MTVTVEALRQGLADNMGPLGIQVSPYMLSNPTPPAIQIYPALIDYDLALQRGLDKWMFTVQAFVGMVSDLGAQQRLDQLIDPKGSGSLKQAVESDIYLGGIAADVSALTCSGYRVYQRDQGGPVLGAEWAVQVYAAGNQL